jgi:hypothetical protein
MKKIIKLTESDLSRIVKRVIKENDDYDNEVDERMVDADNYADELFWEMNNRIEELFKDFLHQVNVDEIIKEYQDKFRESEYGQYIKDAYDYNLDDIELLMRYKPIDNDELSGHLTISLFELSESKSR